MTTEKKKRFYESWVAMVAGTKKSVQHQLIERAKNTKLEDFKENLETEAYYQPKIEHGPVDPPENCGNCNLHSLDKPVFSDRKFSVYLVENSSMHRNFQDR